MTIIHKTALVKHSAAQMFILVKDVLRYPEFLPWCHSTRILREDTQKLCAEIIVARLGIRQTFSTCNQYIPDHKMSIELQSGPFRTLRGAWNFLALRSDACKVSLELEFEFSGTLIDYAFGSIFNQAANSLVDAFCTRADEVYCDK
ncbi:cyclase [Achromatium sp. WMS3]|nr:cyclase [Achromatium sp. WMS3]